MSDAFHLRICSWNVLSTAYCRHKTYPYCHPSLLSPEKRVPMILAMLASKNADIYCLQEVDFMSAIRAWCTEHGYAYHFKQRTGKKKDGCLTMWRQSELSLVSVHDVEFNNVIHDRKYVSTYQASLSTYTSRFKRDYVASILQLQHKTNSSPFCVSNCHLYWNPAYPDVKLRQAAFLLDKIAHVATSRVVLCGDFNSVPSSTVYDFIVSRLAHERVHEQSDTKLLLEGDLSRVGKWLRMLGIDVHIKVSPTFIAQELFDHARHETRVLVTRNRRLVQRSQCPSSLLIPSGLSTEEAFQFIVAQFDLHCNDEAVFRRCLRCNGVIQPLSLEEARSFNEFPKKLEHSGSSFNIDVHKLAGCRPCDKVYWWGERSFKKLDELRSIFAQKHSFEVREATSTLEHPIELYSAFGDYLDSEQEPPYTNHVPGFRGTLDYIFVTKDISLEHIEPLDDDDSVLPSLACPSDHLPLVASFCIT